MDEVKYNLLTNHFKSHSYYIFPVKSLHGSNISLKFPWLIEYPFLVYSKINDSVCCLPRVCFVKTTKTFQPNLLGFQNGIKLVINLKQLKSIMAPIQLQWPQQMGFKERFDKPSSTLTYRYDNRRIERVQHNREILKWVIKTIELYNASP